MLGGIIIAGLVLLIAAIVAAGYVISYALSLAEIDEDGPLPCFRKKDSCGFVDSDGASAFGTGLSSSIEPLRVSPLRASIPDAGIALDSSSHSRPVSDERL